MPRKKKGLKFELLPRPTKDENGKPLLYARPAIRRKWSMKWLDDFCNKYRGLQKGELEHAFNTFLDAAVIHMADGSRIETPFGSFSIKLKIKGDFSDPKKVKHDDVTFGGIEYIPSKRFTQELLNHIEDGFLKDTDPYDREAIRANTTHEEALQKCLQKGYTTINHFCYHSGLKYKAGQRFLNSLCEGDNPSFCRYKEGTTYIYRPVVQKEAK